MVRRKSIRFLTAALLSVILTGALLAGFPAGAAGESVFSGGDGTYSVPVRYDLKMGADQFSSPVTVEVLNGACYLTVGYSSSIGYLELKSDAGKVGVTAEEKDGWTYCTFTLAEERLKNSLSFSAYIKAMSREMEFSLSLDLAAASKTSDTIRGSGERPAEFVPVIETGAAAEYSLGVGMQFPVPAASATLGDEACDISVIARYGGEVVGIQDGKLSLDRVGEYTLVYRAESEKYRTSLGNPTFAEYTVTIHSVTGENGLAKLHDPNGVLPDGTGVLAGRADEASADFAKASAAMKAVSDHFEVFTVSLFTKDGEKAVGNERNGLFELWFRADDRFDRTATEVYRLEENGTLTKLSAKGYGRYVIAGTDRGGVFIVCVPGVAFRMPMWGYALIFAGVCILVAAVVAVVVTRRRKKIRTA